MEASTSTDRQWNLPCISMDASTNFQGVNLIPPTTMENSMQVNLFPTTSMEVSMEVNSSMENSMEVDRKSEIMWWAPADGKYEFQRLFSNFRTTIFFFYIFRESLNTKEEKKKTN